jgi:hypothetical protein
MTTSLVQPAKRLEQPETVPSSWIGGVFEGRFLEACGLHD